MAGKNSIVPTGTPIEQLEKFRKAILEIDATAAGVKLDMDKFDGFAQDKRKGGFLEQAVGFEASRDKLACKHLAYIDVLRIIKRNVE